MFFDAVELHNWITSIAIYICVCVCVHERACFHLRQLGGETINLWGIISQHYKRTNTKAE